MKRVSSRELTADELEQLRALEAMTDADIDLSDMPEVTDWSGAVRGKFYKPVKRQITLRLDADVVDFFERDGRGYQTRINDALRQWVAAQRAGAKKRA